MKTIGIRDLFYGVVFIAGIALYGFLTRYELATTRVAESLWIVVKTDKITGTGKLWIRPGSVNDPIELK